MITSRGWRNREPDDSVLIQYLNKKHSNKKNRGNDVMYTLHIPSFSEDKNGIVHSIISFLVGHGTYASTIPLLPYLKDLGVTIIRLMDLTPQRCVNDTIDVNCWCKTFES